MIYVPSTSADYRYLKLAIQPIFRSFKCLTENLSCFSSICYFFWGILWQISVPGLYDAPSFYRSARGRSFDDSETYFVNNKQTGRVRAAAPENNVLKSFAADKDKASNVAKIKVVVCFTIKFPS